MITSNITDIAFLALSHATSNQLRWRQFWPSEGDENFRDTRITCKSSWEFIEKVLKYDNSWTKLIERSLSSCPVLALNRRQMLFCHFDFSPVYEWKWIVFKLGFISFSADWNLEINPVTLDDDAEFQCQVPIARLQSRIAYLNVWVPPEEPRIPDGPVVQVWTSFSLLSYSIFTN